MSTISVVIPTHFRADYLELSLASVSDQTRQPDNVVVVSDVRDDDARRIVDEFSVATGIPTTYIESSDGQSGAASSRNVGAGASSGERIAFLDDDDLWAPDYLETAEQVADGDGVELVVTWLEEFSEDRRREGESMPRGLAPQDAAAMNPGATGSNILVMRSAFDRIGGFDPELRVKNDTDFLFRFLRSGGSYSIVEQRLVHQRKHQSGQLTAKTEMRAAGTELYISKHLSRLTAQDYRTLRLYVLRIRSHAAPTRLGRLLNLASMARYYSLAEISERLRRGRDTTYINVRGFSGDRT